MASLDLGSVHCLVWVGRISGPWVQCLRMEFTHLVSLHLSYQSQTPHVCKLFCIKTVFLMLIARCISSVQVGPSATDMPWCEWGWFVCWFVCLSVNKITQKVMNGLQWNFMGRSVVIKGTSDLIVVAIWITMLTVQSEIRPLFNNLLPDFDEIFRKALQRYKEQLIKFLGLIWITMLTLQTWIREIRG